MFYWPVSLCGKTGWFQKGITSQLVLAWVMAQGDFIFPIPGTKRIKYLEENAGSLLVQFTRDELNAIDIFFQKNAAAGLRYTEQMIPGVNV